MVVSNFQHSPTNSFILKPANYLCNSMSKDSISYKDAGVDKEEGYKAVELMKKKVEKTLNQNVLSGLGSFGAFYALGNFKEPVLVSGTDGVGTKLKIAFATNTYDTVGQDCVAMCVNDILCHGAKPLFFLDYLACGKLDANVAAEIVGGIADGCEASGTALVGGETAEMPGFYKDGEYDIAGFTVGVVERSNVIDGSKVKTGDVIIALASSGIHSNGFSLVRKLIPDFTISFDGKPIGQTLLEPTKIYVKPILSLLEKFDIHGMAHITGGGLVENVPRTIPKTVDAHIRKENIQVLPIFDYLVEQGANKEDMWGTFNMGVGFTIIVDQNDVSSIIEHLSSMGEHAYEIGNVVDGSGEIQLV